MSKHHLRKDKTCLNCGQTVEKRFCPDCGQENTETRQSFGHLVRHFIEDFTHYEGSFWRTIKYLMFRPAYLTKVYLAGQRISYVVPVKLYIFISFVTFFIPYLLPDLPEQYTDYNVREERTEGKKELYGIGFNLGDMAFYARSRFSSPKQYDSVQRLLPPEQRDGFVVKWFKKKEIELTKYAPEEIANKFNESFEHNFPKALFLYLPMFAFVIWIFHGKKRWYYFDHAIFTLHYFSFLLLTFTLLSIITFPPWSNLVSKESYSTLIYFVLILPAFIWIIYYFFRAHRKMYAESWIVSFLKSLFIFTINSILFLILLAGLGLLTIFNLH
jgi:hypothetical protein